MRRVLPEILAWLTGHGRYLPDIKWSANSWTHNFFRVYELIFWRRIGIKAEMSCMVGPGSVTYQAHSFEASCALFEQGVRELFNRRLPLRVWIPMVVTTEGLPKPASPYLFAIALDTSLINTDPGTKNMSYTCTGSDRVMVLFCKDGYQGTFTYNSISLSTVAAYSTKDTCVFYLLAPSTGSNTIAMTTGNPGFPGGWRYIATSYTGVKQSGFPDSSAAATATANPTTLNTTVVAPNCWLWGGGSVDTTANDAAGISRTTRQHGNYSFGGGGQGGVVVGDSNGTVATGSQGFDFTSNLGSHNQAQHVLSIEPFVPSNFPKMLKNNQAVFRASSW